MRRELGIMAIVVATGLLIAPNAQVGAQLIQPPTLDWFHEGHTLEYSITNGTSTLILNATIQEVDGNNLTWRYWTTSGGTEKELNWRWQNKDRQDLNVTGFYTYLWVNSTNVDGGVGDVALIGDSDYSLDGVTLDHFVFSNGSWTFRYDLAKGWLDEADYEGQVQVELLGHRDIPVGDHRPLYSCSTHTSESSIRIYSEEDCTGYTATAFGAFDMTGRSSPPCNVDYEGEVGVLWPHWHLVLYKYKFQWTDIEGTHVDVGWVGRSLDDLTRISPRTVTFSESVTSNWGSFHARIWDDWPGGGSEPGEEPSIDGAIDYVIAFTGTYAC